MHLYNIVLFLSLCLHFNKGELFDFGWRNSGNALRNSKPKPQLQEQRNCNWGGIFKAIQSTSSRAPHHTRDNSKKQSKINYVKKKSFVLPRKFARLLYIITALNPALAVVFNDYTKMLRPFRPLKTQQHALARTYGTLFFFARLKPRVAFAIGAMLRALQLSTALRYVFDPAVGVGLGLDLLSLFARSRWPATIVLGWSITAPAWKILGACPPSSLPVPISISMPRPGTLEQNRDARSRTISDD